MSHFDYLFSKLLIRLVNNLLFSSCNKDDEEVASTPLNDFGTQFKTDSIAIDKYLKTHYLNLESVTDIASVVNSADLIKKMPLAVEKRIKGKICVIPSGLKTDEELICRVRELRKQASKIGKELDELFFRTNKAWALFYDYIDKT